MTSDPIWDPERLALVGSVLNRYAAHLAPGHRIRMGLEGDPAGVYKGADAPCATVTDVRRDPSGAVQFTAQMDGTHALVHLDNRNVAPDRIWEIEPAYLETFRGFVDRALDGGQEEERDQEEREDPTREEERSDAEEERGHAEEESEQPSHDSRPPSPPSPPTSDDRYAFRSAVDEQIASMESRIARVEHDLAAAVAELAGDLMRSSRGAELQFCDRYVDRYEAALHDYRGDLDPRNSTRHDEEGAVLDSFRSAERSEDEKRHTDRHQKEKYVWDEVTPLRYDDLADDKALTDDE